MNPGFWTGHLRLWCHFMKWEVKQGEKSIPSILDKSGLRIHGGLVPEPPRIPKSIYVQSSFCKTV